LGKTERKLMSKQFKSGSKTLLFLTPFIILLFVIGCSKKESVKKTPLFEPVTEFQLAKEKIEKKRYEEAREILGKIKTRDTTGKYATLAQVRIGDTYYKEGLYKEAAVEYEHFLKIHSHNRYAPYTQYQLAMTFFKRIRTADVSYSTAKRALEEFEKLLRLYPRNRYVKVVEIRMRTCRNVLADYEFYVGKFYFKKNSYRAAAGRFAGLLKDYPDSKRELEALYLLGLSYKNTGQKDKSREVLTTLVEKFPATDFSKEARAVIASLKDEEK
jgi:outer membrane protein assembly factor BamD